MLRQLLLSSHSVILFFKSPCKYVLKEISAHATGLMKYSQVRIYLDSNNFHRFGSVQQNSWFEMKQSEWALSVDCPL